MLRNSFHERFHKLLWNTARDIYITKQMQVNKIKWINVTETNSTLFASNTRWNNFHKLLKSDRTVKLFIWDDIQLYNIINKIKRRKKTY